MRRVLPFAIAILPALVAVALASPNESSRTGTITFNGRILDGTEGLTPGRIVTIRGNVVARADNCIEARVDAPQPAGQPNLWLCSPDGQVAGRMPDVGEPVAARARITRIRTSAEGDIPLSDSFVLMRAD